MSSMRLIRTEIIFAVNGRDEGHFELVADGVADRVAGVLDVAQLAGEPFALVVVPEELLQQPGCGEHVARIFDEHVEEFLFARDEWEAHRSTSSS